MSLNFGLSQTVIQNIISIFKNHKHVNEVIIYGSRAMGNFRPGSDIDLTIKGDNLILDDQLKIENEIDDLDLPYKIDLSLFHMIDNIDLIDHINRRGKVFYQR